jgi:hypothetical protein
MALRIVYSFNKKGEEAEYWTREIQKASDAEYEFIPFNHDLFLDPMLYIRAQLLDNLYHAKDARLAELYRSLTTLLEGRRPHAVIVDTCPPYHPEFLRTLPVYKVLRIADGPMSAYDRDFAYLHAYHHVLYHSPAYSRDLGMKEKLEYCGAKNSDLWPLALFDRMFSPEMTESRLFSLERDLEIVFVGALHVGKMPILARLKKRFGRRFHLHGFSSLKRNVYFNLKYGLPGWVTQIEVSEYTPLYQRARIGINLHNRGKYTVGNYRMFDLAGNGAFQLSDGDEYLNEFFRVGEEIVGYSDEDDLVRKIEYYLDHDDERQKIAVNAFGRVLRDHRIGHRLKQAGRLIEGGMNRIGWKIA